MAASVFKDVQLADKIEVFALTARYNQDDYKEKVNLGVGAYRTDDGKPMVLQVVKMAEKQMVDDDQLNHEYLPVAGLPAFREASIRLVLGEDSPAIMEQRVEGIQCLGGTGAIRLAAEFLKKKLGYDTVYVSKPTWGNHKKVFQNAYVTQIREYRYWNPATRGLDLDGMLEDLSNAPVKSVVILHAVAHNPTGVDPTQEQWHQIVKVCKEKELFILLDNAYQGFATGDVEGDGFPARYMVSQGLEFFIAQSFSKNFGLYNERTGNLCFVSNDAQVISKVKSQMEILVRTMWSNPPNHGARIVATVLNNKTLAADWRTEVKAMADRISLMRKLLHEKIRAKGTPGNWNHIITQIGMFCYTGLTVPQVNKLINEFHIYLLQEGRINMCAITTKNVDYIADSIHSVVTSVSDGTN